MPHALDLRLLKSILMGCGSPIWAHSVDISMVLVNRESFFNCFPGCRNSKTINNFGRKIVFEFLQPGKQLRKDPTMLRLIEISITTNFLRKNDNTLRQLT
jgi:hypothetical protein